MLQQRRAVLVVGAIVSLVLLNIWRWWPEERLAGAATEPGRMAMVLPEALHVQGLIGAERMPGPSQRDLFAVVERESVVVQLVPVEPERPTPAPRVEAPPARNDNIQRGMGTFRLDGTLVRDGRTQAFLSRADAVFRVHAGDRLDNRFLVESVHQDRVVLRDPGGSGTYTLRLEE